MFSLKLWREASSDKSSLFFSVFFGVILGGFIVAQAWILSRIISDAFLLDRNLGELNPNLISLGLVILGRGLAAYGRDLTSGVVSISVRKKLKEQLIAHLLNVSPVNLIRAKPGEVTTTLIQGVDRLDDYFRSYLPQLLISAILPIIVLMVVFPKDWVTGVILLVSAPMIPLFMVLIGKQAEKETTRQWKILKRLGGHFFDVIKGLGTLKIFGLSKAQRKIVRTMSDRYADATLKVLRVAFLSALTLEIFSTISTALIAVQIGVRLLYGNVSFQNALFMLVLAPDFYFPLRQLGAAFHSGMSGIQSADSIYEILLMPTMPSSLKNMLNNKILKGKIGSIKFDQVSFSYKDSDYPSLESINFEILPDSITALVGPSGAGKSTILSLLLRFIEPAQGEIAFVGENLMEIPADLWRSHVAWVPQSPYLFNGTIQENFLIAKPTASFQEIRNAAQKAHLDDFVLSLSAKYETQIGEDGARLSSGQAQRLAIARAFLKESKILLLDEPSKHLDIESEELINDTFQQLTSNKMVLIIAHRLSTIAQSNQVVVLDKGRIIQVGQAEILREKEGFFRDIFESVGTV